MGEVKLFTVYLRACAVRTLILQALDNMCHRPVTSGVNSNINVIPVYIPYTNLTAESRSVRHPIKQLCSLNSGEMLVSILALDLSFISFYILPLSLPCSTNLLTPRKLYSCSLLLPVSLKTTISIVFIPLIWMASSFFTACSFPIPQIIHLIV